ncbi:hypothetical protein AAG906_023449 [Vitis piasezkii]
MTYPGSIMLIYHASSRWSTAELRPHVKAQDTCIMPTKGSFQMASQIMYLEFTKIDISSGTGNKYYAD